MKVFSALLGELKGIFGKTYLFAGALPAALLVLGWAWFDSGESLPGLLRTLITGFAEEGANDVLAAGVAVLLLGLAFFAGRALLVELLQRLPGRLLKPMRGWLTRWQLRRWVRAEHACDVATHLLTVSGPWPTNLDFNQPTYLPATETAPDAAAMQTVSRKGREAFLKLTRKARLPVKPPGARKSKKVLQGLRQLYAHARDHYAAQECAEEVGQWRALRERMGGKELLKLLAADVRRTWAEARLRLEAFPGPEWIRPTALGTRASALDDYAEKRYGIDTSTLLTRLWGVLGDDDKAGLNDSRLSIEVLVNLAAAMTLLALGVAASAARQVASQWPVSPEAGVILDLRTTLFLVVPAVLVRLFYRAAVFSYGSLAEKIVRCVDLNRLALLKKLGFATPAHVGEERELWAELATFFTAAAALDPDRPIKPPDGD